LGRNDLAFFDSNLAVNYVTFGSDHQKLVGNPNGRHDVAAAPCNGTSIIHFACVNWHIFDNCSQTQHRPQTWVYLGKANEMYIPIMYYPYGNIINFSRTIRIHFFYKIRHWNHWVSGGKRPQSPPISLEIRGPLSNTWMLGWPHSPLQTAARSLNALPHNYVTNAPLVTIWDTPNSTQKPPLPFDDHHPHLIHPSFDRPYSPSQTASGSNQPFCHNTLCGPKDRPTDRQTDRWSRRMFHNTSAPLAMLIESDPLKT